MRTTYLRQADLNLLVVFTVLAEERNISAAAKRLLLSQPAVTRAFQRLQAMFGDQLLVRVKGSYELTNQGARILAELEAILPRLDKLVRGNDFDPETESAKFRIVGTDYLCSVLGLPLAKQVLTEKSKVSLEFIPWSETVYESLEHGRTDIAFSGDHGVAPPHLRREVLLREKVICVVAKESSVKSKLSLAVYAQLDHVIVSLVGTEQPFPDRPLAKLGVKRKCRLRVPYFASALDVIAGTNIVATVPMRSAYAYMRDSTHASSVRLVAAPPQIEDYGVIMLWHPRLDTEAANCWLRDQIRATASNV